MSDTALTPQEVQELLTLQKGIPQQAPMSSFERDPIGSEIMKIARGGRSVATGAAGFVADAWTGNKQRTAPLREMTPALAWGDDSKSALVSFLGNASANDPVGYANIMAKTLPGAKVTFDKNNNPLINWNGQQYYANDPGMSGNDAMRLATDVVAFLPAAKFASAAKGALGGMGRGGLGSGLTNLVQQLSGKALGSDQDVNLGNVGIAGMSGAAGEAISRFISPVATNAYAKLGSGPIMANGGPTPFGKAFVQTQGIDPETVTEATWQAMDRFYRQMSGGVQAGIRQGLEAGNITGQAADEASQAVSGAFNAASRGQPGVLPKTSGMMSRNQDQLDFEEMARTGRFGDKARGLMAEFDRTQNQSFRDEAFNLMNMAGGGVSRGATPEAVGGAISESVKRAESGAWKGVQDAYAAVPDARLSADPLINLPNRIGASLRELDIYPDRTGFASVYPRTAYALNSLRATMTEKAKLPPSKRSFGLMELEQMRKSVNKYITPAADTPDDVALIAMKRKIDQAVEETWDAALLKGDETALDQLKAARNARTEYGLQFEPKNVEKTVTSTLNRMINMPDIDNHAVVNWVLGSAETGFSNASLQMTKQLKKVLGTDSDGWNAVREAAMQRVIFGSGSNSVRDAMWNPDKVVSKSTGQLLRRLDNFLDLGGSGVMKEMFSKGELDQLRRFRYELRQIQPSENAATLRTGASLPLWFNRVGNWISGAIGAKLGVGPQVGQAAGQAASAYSAGLTNAAKAVAAVGGWQPPRVKSYPVFSALGTAGLSGLSYGDGGNRESPRQ